VRTVLVIEYANVLVISCRATSFSYRTSRFRFEKLIRIDDFCLSVEERRVALSFKLRFDEGVFMMPKVTSVRSSMPDAKWVRSCTGRLVELSVGYSLFV
jgi:hypothetical protein